MPKCKIGRCTPAQIASSWNAGFSAGAETARQTVAAGNVHWATPTVAQEAVIAQGIASAFSSGRWRQGVQRTGDVGWKNAMMAKGIPHMAAGSQAGAQHYARFRQDWDAMLNVAIAALPPRGTYEQNKQRASQMQDAMHSQKGRFKGLWKGQGGGGP